MFEALFGSKKSPSNRQLVAPTIGNIVEGETAVSSDRVKMGEIFGWDPNPSGAPVTDKTAMRVSVVYACVQRIAGAIAGLPLPIYERVGEDRMRVQHDLWWLLNEQPCAAWTAAAFWEFLVTQFLLRDDGIAYIVRNRAGVPTGFIPWPRSQVEIRRTERTDPRLPSRLQYYFSDAGKYFGADQDDVLHFPGFGFNGTNGMSVIQWGARNGIGIAIRGDEYAGKFFAGGARPQHAITTPGEFTPDQQQKFREAWVQRYSGSAGVDAIPFFLTEGLGITELTMSAVDAQLLESRQWQVIDICRAFGVPPFMVGEMGKATYNNTENLGVDFVKYALAPHLNRIKQELNIKLFRGPRFFTEHNVDGLMRGDSKARSEFYKAALGGTQNPGWMTPNQVRKLENLPPEEGGNKLYKPEPSAKPATETPEESEDPKDPNQEETDETEPA
jgi:HK97 family phage portal protein